MGKVLIIEDDPLINKIYKTRLSKDGHQVELADNGKDGLVLALKIKPDVVLLDIMLPQVSGLDVLKELKKTPSTAKIPVIVYSNLSKEEEINKAKKLGASEYIIKANMSPHQLVAKIEKYL
ncbi:hypothetical protein A3J78_00940 [Candidatus Beckwithbacteria bacterium RBG_13_35_6]|uniref:Response regulatory domain-containing protein n=1 Tax=Candidatus Beckwithbacteria bacterium RBG_13_35_6 TaxID=1797456 RepID=A0A1F5DE04_9BACT|nr:MAG: hypothetical protein A3J78_00940 [Candidatus Beckwithbacteria bacterium RBG_13_35_6]